MNGLEVLVIGGKHDGKMLDVEKHFGVKANPLLTTIRLPKFIGFKPRTFIPFEKINDKGMLGWSEIKNGDFYMQDEIVTNKRTYAVYRHVRLDRYFWAEALFRGYCESRKKKKK